MSEKHLKPLNVKHIGSDLDDLLAEEGLLAEVEAAALKRVAALELQDLMKRAYMSKTVLARRMGTSRAQLDRLLDPENAASLTLRTLSTAAAALDHAVTLAFRPLERRRRRGRNRRRPFAALSGASRRRVVARLKAGKRKKPAAKAAN